MDMQRKLEGFLFLRACPESACVFSGVRSGPSSLTSVWSCFPYVVNRCVTCSGPQRPTFPASHFYRARRGGRSQSSCLCSQECSVRLDFGTGYVARAPPPVCLQTVLSGAPLQTLSGTTALCLRGLALPRGPCQEPTLSPQVGGSVPAPILPSAACASVPFCPHRPGTQHTILCFSFSLLPNGDYASNPCRRTARALRRWDTWIVPH